MCLGVPGRSSASTADPLGMPMGRVDFGGVVSEVCLAYVPEAAVGDYVVVHVGFAISRGRRGGGAAQCSSYLREMGELDELDRSRRPLRRPAGGAMKY